MPMRRQAAVLAVVGTLVVCLTAVAPSQDQDRPVAGQSLKPSPFNLSFPVVVTAPIAPFYRAPVHPETGLPVADDPKTPENEAEPVPVVLEESIVDPYTGEFINEDQRRHWDAFCVLRPEDDPETEDIDESQSQPMTTWLRTYKPWYSQAGTVDPATGARARNVWQAGWIKSDEGVHYVEFVDWGDPLESQRPAAGRPFPLEVALYERLDAPLAAYVTACLAYPESADAVYGTSKLGGAAFTFPSSFATLVTPAVSAEIWGPDGGIVELPLEPRIGPDGRAVLAAAGEGWTPAAAGEYRIWLRVADPRVSLDGATVNDRANVNLAAGTICDELGRNRLARTGITGNSAFIDILVVAPPAR